MTTTPVTDIRGQLLKTVQATCSQCRNYGTHALDHQGGRDWYECQRCGARTTAESVRREDSRINRRG